MGHEITLPNSFDDPGTEERMKKMSPTDHRGWKAKMLKLSENKISGNDAMLVINVEKNGVPNYIGGATFLEMYEAFKMSKKIFIYNPIPDGILHDEIMGMGPEIILGDLQMIQ